MRLRLLTILVTACALLGASTTTAQEIITSDPAVEPPAQPGTWTHVRVITDDGWHLDDVTVAWLKDGSAIRVTRADGAWTDYRPEAVVAVMAADGTDLTPDVADARPASLSSWAGRGLDTSRARAAAAVAAATAKAPPPPSPIRLALTAGGTYGFFTGGWFTGFDPSPGLQAAARIGGVGRGWVTVAYHRQGGGGETFSGTDSENHAVTVNLDVHIDEYRFMFGLPTKEVTPRSKVPYVEFGLVFMRHVGEADVAGTSIGNYVTTKGGPVVQLGGLVGLGGGWIADAGASMAYKLSEGDDGAAGTIYSMHLGLGYAVW